MHHTFRALAAGGLAHIAGVQPVFVLTGGAALVMGCVLKRKIPDLSEKARSALAEKERMGN